MNERCYRLANHSGHSGTVDARGGNTRDALITRGFTLVAEIDCLHGTITSQADPEYVAQGERERAAWDELEPMEQRQLRRMVGPTLVEPPGWTIPWGVAQQKAAD